MTPPNIPPSKPAESIQTANIIVEALIARGYTAGVYSPCTDPVYDFDIQAHTKNVVVGSRRRNRSYLSVSWHKKELVFEIFGRRWSPKGEYTLIDLADPESMDEIVDLILKVATEDKFKYPFL